MKTIYDTIDLNGLKLKSRIVRSATYERAVSEAGQLDVEFLKRIYGEMSANGVGAIITGMMGINPEGCLSPKMVKIYEEGFVPALREIAELVHKNDTKIIVQLGHCGVKSGGSKPSDRVFGPSAVEAIPERPAEAMTQQEIEDAVRDFARAALKCKEAGIDGVQIHAAHGYLVSQFLSPLYNHREDHYGGDIENRARILIEMYDAIRQAVGEDFPVWIKINYEDYNDPGLTGEECSWVCCELEKRGLQAIELSAGIATGLKTTPVRNRIRERSQEAYIGDSALKLSEMLRIPVISVGGYRTPDVLDEYLNRGNIAAISLARPLVCESNLITRWHSGDRRKSLCISCNKCFGGDSFRCQQEHSTLLEMRGE